MDVAGDDAALAGALDGLAADYQRAEPGHFLVRLPGENRLATMCWLLVGQQGLRVEAFVLRGPAAEDGDVPGLHRELLRRNGRLLGIGYSIDPNGDVYLTGGWPLSAVDADSVDRLLGMVLSEADGGFNDLLRIGYAEAIRREHRWRSERGESLANLRAFAGIIDSPGAR